MKPLNPIPLTWASKVFEIARLCRDPRRTRILNANQVILTRFGEYHRNKYDLFPVQDSALTAPLSTDLLYCYTSEKLPLSKMKAAIAAAQDPGHGTLCQYCGVDHASSTDHYIPKDDFPEFSVLPINLIPCCRVCNRNKDELWRDQTGRTIVNFYFDNIPKYKYLHAEVVTPPGRAPFAHFFLDFDRRIDGKTQRLITEHFRILKLLDLYRTESSQSIVLAKNLLSVLLGQHAQNDAVIQVNLKRLSESHRKQYGENYWKAELFEAISVYPHLMH